MDAVFAVASPDQFAQIILNTEGNDFLISNVYYGGLEQGTTSVKNAATNCTENRQEGKVLFNENLRIVSNGTTMML